MNKVKTNRKGGAEKIRDKRIAELKVDDNSSDFFPRELWEVRRENFDNFNDDTSEFEIKTNIPIFSSVSIKVYYIPTTSLVKYSNTYPVCTSTSTVHDSNNLNINEKCLELVIESDETKNPTFFSVEDIIIRSNININSIIDDETVDLKFPTNPKNLTVVQKLEFVNTIHPCQPKFLENVAWSLHKIYNRTDLKGNLIPRKWLTVKCKGNNYVEAVYCTIWMVFSSSASNFCSGCTNFKNIYATIESHENSQVHGLAVEAYILASNNYNIENSVNINMMNLKKKQALERIHVLEQVFEIVKLLGKQNLPYRGSGSSESLYNINCENINYNRGNFLELLKFTAKRDSILNDYLTVAIESSKKRKENISNNSKRRGSLVTMLSKNTVNKVILAILELIRRKIKGELGDKQFSIQVGSTQDIGSTDQAAVCIRYVFKSEVKERLFAVLEVKNSSGKGIYKLLKKYFDDHLINFKNIVGESFDGAANMRGDFNGLHAYIKKENKNSIYIWCYAHILNLCICDTCDNKDAIKLFGLLNRLSTFFSDSYKRMNAWKEQQEQLGTGQNKLRKLQKIGETRWWS
ncbi:zinc finger MYM-type protein 1-like [Hydra vulgaris]|uniref:Zinc finger MYM-type protein 1-like n=1 Tax=Hydra vulgaris TaxID=6087 RepID=A0ABM4C9U0_HYDVU